MAVPEGSRMQHGSWICTRPFSVIHTKAVGVIDTAPMIKEYLYHSLPVLVILS